MDFKLIAERVDQVQAVLNNPACSERQLKEIVIDLIALLPKLGEPIVTAEDGYVNALAYGYNPSEADKILGLHLSPEDIRIIRSIAHRFGSLQEADAIIDRAVFSVGNFITGDELAEDPVEAMSKGLRDLVDAAETAGELRKADMVYLSDMSTADTAALTNPIVQHFGLDRVVKFTEWMMDTVGWQTKTPFNYTLVNLATTIGELVKAGHDYRQQRRNGLPTNSGTVTNWIINQMADIYRNLPQGNRAILIRGHWDVFGLDKMPDLTEAPPSVAEFKRLLTTQFQETGTGPMLLAASVVSMAVPSSGPRHA